MNSCDISLYPYFLTPLLIKGINVMFLYNFFLEKWVNVCIVDFLLSAQTQIQIYYIFTYRTFI